MADKITLEMIGEMQRLGDPDKMPGGPLAYAKAWQDMLALPVEPNAYDSESTYDWAQKLKEILRELIQFRNALCQAIAAK